MPELDFVMAFDPTRMIQVFSNLLSNAIKYTPEGGCVVVEVRRQGRWVHLNIQDTGLGIPVEALPHLFNKFYRVQRNDHLRSEGTGLGLSIVKAIVEQHGGSISVESELEKGTRFLLDLPIMTL
ncbi:MAG: ATP-binding protein [Anaerolineae bacterium]|nr:ATP-binding protein [Anaerolineae bacterium]